MRLLSRIVSLFAGRQTMTDQQMFYQKELYNGPVKINGDQYANLPNPGPVLQGDYQVDPGRLFSPDPHFRTNFDQLNRGSGDPVIERTPDLCTTKFLKEYHTIDTIEVKVPAHGVFVPGHVWSMGWKQQWVPNPLKRRAAEVGNAPPPLLSAPIRSVTIDVSTQGKRTPVKLKAPKPNKGV